VSPRKLKASDFVQQVEKQIGKTSLSDRHTSFVEHVAKSEFFFDVCLSLCVHKHDVERVTEYIFDCSLISLPTVLHRISDHSSEWISSILPRVKDDTPFSMCHVLARTIMREQDQERCECVCQP